MHVGRTHRFLQSVVSKRAQRLSPRGPVGPNRFQSRWCSARVVSTVLTPALRLTYWATTRTAADQMIQSMRDFRVEPAARELDHNPAPRVRWSAQSRRSLRSSRRSPRSSRRSSRRSERRLTPCATTATVPTVAAVRATVGAQPPRAGPYVVWLKACQFSPSVAASCSVPSASSFSSASIAASIAWMGMRPLATS